MTVRFEDENGADISARVSGTVVVATQAQPPVEPPPPPPPPPAGTESVDGTLIANLGDGDIIDSFGARWNVDWTKPHGDGHAFVILRDGVEQTNHALELYYKNHMVHTRTANYGWWRRRLDGAWESCANPR